MALKVGDIGAQSQCWLLFFLLSLHSSSFKTWAVKPYPASHRNVPHPFLRLFCQIFSSQQNPVENPGTFGSLTLAHLSQPSTADVLRSQEGSMRSVPKTRPCQSHLLTWPQNLWPDGTTRSSTLLCARSGSGCASPRKSFKNAFPPVRLLISPSLTPVDCGA